MQVEILVSNEEWYHDGMNFHQRVVMPLYNDPRGATRVPKTAIWVRSC